SAASAVSVGPDTGRVALLDAPPTPTCSAPPIPDGPCPVCPRLAHPPAPRDSQEYPGRHGLGRPTPGQVPVLPADLPAASGPQDAPPGPVVGCRCHAAAPAMATLRAVGRAQD